MPASLLDLIFTLNRCAHIVATTVLVGGVLFFRFVVPHATAHLKDEQQLAVFGQARWLFRRIVGLTALALILSGLISLWRVWPVYTQEGAQTRTRWLTSLPWAIGHVVLGLIGFALAFRVTATARLVNRPIRWLSITLTFLLVAIFLASAARHVELHLGYGLAHK
jgi:hypothetical protein